MFDNRLIKLREEMKKTKKEVADALGMPYNTYSNYESNLREPNSAVLIKIADFYNVSIDYLLGLSNIKSVDTDMQTACKYTGLSDEAMKNIKSSQKMDLSYEISLDTLSKVNDIFYNATEIINMILSSSFFSEQVSLIGIYVNEIINKYHKKTIVDNLDGEIKKFNYTECEERLRLCGTRNKLQKEWEDLEERTYYNEFRLTKLFGEFLSNLNCTAKETAKCISQKEHDSNADNNPQKE